MFARKLLRAVALLGVGFAMAVVSGAEAEAQQTHTGRPSRNYPRTRLDDDVDQVGRENTNARLEVVSGQRTVSEQAPEMLRLAQRYQRRGNPDAFVSLYGGGHYAREMVEFVRDNPGATRQEALGVWNGNGRRRERSC